LVPLEESGNGFVKLVFRLGGTEGAGDEPALGVFDVFEDILPQGACNICSVNQFSRVSGFFCNYPSVA